MGYTKAEYIAKHGEEAWLEYKRKKAEYDKERRKSLTKETYIKEHGEDAWVEFTKNKYARTKEWREQNKEHIVEYNKMNHARYYETNKEKVAKAGKERYKRDKEKILARNRAYSKQKTIERQEARRKYQEEHREEIEEAKRAKEIKRKERIKDYKKEYYKTYSPPEELKKKWRQSKNEHRLNSKKDRAQVLVDNYRRHDKEREYDTSSNVSVNWVINNIFSGQKCAYCGDDNWQHLGCDRKDDSLPHIADNIVPCCRDCNAEKGLMGMNYDEFIKYRAFRPRDGAGAIVGNIIENGVIKKRAVI